MADEFDLLEDHLKLLRASHVFRDLLDAETGSAYIDPKRPYGNSDVEGDVAELLGWWKYDPHSDDTLPGHMRDLARALHRDTPTALQIVLTTGEFKTGRYRRRDRYNPASWEYVGPIEVPTPPPAPCGYPDEHRPHTWMLERPPTYEREGPYGCPGIAL